MPLGDNKNNPKIQDVELTISYSSISVNWYFSHFSHKKVRFSNMLFNDYACLCLG